MTRNEYEKRIRQLIGKSVAKVVYHELDYLDGQFRFFDDPRFDSLDYGFELELGTGELVSITLGAEFVQYGVSLIDAAMLPVVSRSPSYARIRHVADGWEIS